MTRKEAYFVYSNLTLLGWKGPRNNLALFLEASAYCYFPVTGVKATLSGLLFFQL